MAAVEDDESVAVDGAYGRRIVSLEEVLVGGEKRWILASALHWWHRILEFLPEGAANWPIKWDGMTNRKHDLYRTRAVEFHPGHFRVSKKFPGFRGEV